MRLSTIVLSGANEHTDAQAIISLCKNCSYLAELGIQVSGEKAYYSSGRYWWLQLLCHLATPDINIALHLNKDWVEDFCAGKIPPELETFLALSHPDGSPKIKRIQLNFKIGRDKTPNVKLLEEQMMKFPHVRFILSYNKANAALIHEIYCRHNVVFDCLFDESHGEGIVPLKHHTLVFPDVLHGYAGGLSPENVVRELDKIAAILPPEAQIFIDAEGKLKGEDGHFSYSKAHDFVANALQW